MHRHIGFTLFEMVIVMVILSVVLVIAAVSANGWKTGSRIVTANAVNTEALGRLRAMALRNPGNVTISGNASANLRIDGNSLKLCQQEQDCTAASKFPNSPIWTGIIPANTTESMGGMPFTCIALDSRGHVTTLPATTSTAAGVDVCLTPTAIPSITAS